MGRDTAGTGALHRPGYWLLQLRRLALHLRLSGIYCDAGVTPHSPRFLFIVFIIEFDRLHHN